MNKNTLQKLLLFCVSLCTMGSLFAQPVMFTGTLPDANVTAACDAIPAPATLTAEGCLSIAPFAFLNEIHYDNAGGDVGEFFEVAGLAGFDLSNCSVLLYNGSNGSLYNTINLTGTIDDEGLGFGATFSPLPSNGLQNGGPDGLALVCGGAVVEFLSYEGSFTAVGGAAGGMTSTNIGVSETSGTPIGQSLGRINAVIGNPGCTTADFVWAGPNAESPGTLNPGQSFQAGDCSGSTAAIVTLAEATTPGSCAGEFTLVRTYTATDGCGQTAEFIQTITVEDNTAPTFMDPPADLALDCTDPVPAAATVLASDNCSSGSAVAGVWINEIHYDNTGGDVGEFIEIAGTAGFDLAGYTLVTYNGNGGAPYGSTMNLAGMIPSETSGFGAVFFPYPSNGLQNGAPDGVALVDNGGTVVQFLSYEGSFVGNGGPANGMTSTDIGVTEPGAIGESLQLTGTGAAAADFMWVGPLTESPGMLNADQNFATIVATLIETMTGSALCGSIVRTYSADDGCGNVAVHVQTITISDGAAPVVTCPPSQTLSCFVTSPAPVTTPEDFIALGGTLADNCTAVNDLVVFSQDSNNGGDNCPGNGEIITRTYFVTDVCGNVSTCNQVFTYLESTSGPVITSILPTCFKYCASLANPMDTDITYDVDCSFGSTVNITGPQQNGPANCPGTSYTYTYTVVDDCGRVSAPVTRDFVIGNDGPTIDCAPFNLILECGDENNQDYINTHLATATANSSCEVDVNINHFPQSFNLITCGSSTVVTFVATDACGRTATCTTVIAIQDNTAPEFTFEPTLSCDVIECGADAQFFFQKWINANIDSLEATDACDSNVSISAVSPQLNQNCNADGKAITTVTFAARDNCNNIATFTRIFTIQNTAPALFGNVPADATVECTGSAPTFGPTPTVTETCQTTVTSMDTVDDSDPCAVLYTRTWTATDACGGLSTSVSQTITAVDTQAPVTPAAPADVNVQCASDVPAPVDLTAQDACQGAITVSPSAVIIPGNCDNQFMMTRTWTFIDACENQSSVSQNITVFDDTAPATPAAPADVNVQCASDVPAPVDLTANDNCDGDITVSPSAVITPGDCEDQFMMTRTWTFIDMCGNQSSVSQNITVFDDTAPTFTFVPADYTGPCVDEDGNVTVYAQICSSSDDAEEDESNGNEGDMNLTSSDLELSEDNSQNKNVKVGVRFKDLNIPAGATITSAYIQFTADATIDVDPSELTIHGEDSDNATTFTNEDFNISDRPQTDASATWNPGDWQEIGDNLEVERTPDLTSIVQEIVNRGGFTAESALAFVIEGIGKRTAIAYDLNPDQAAELYVTYSVGELFGTPTAQDNCSGVTILFEDEIVLGCDGSITRTWIALDDCGNSEVATQTVNFTGDNVPPVFTFVPASGYDDCDFVTFPPAFGTPVAEDNCGGIVDITFEDYFYEGDEDSCDNEEDYEYRREWTATDDCGNTTTAVQNFDINGTDYSSFTGFIYTEEEAPVEDVQVTLSGSNGLSLLSASGGNGTYGYNSLEVGANYSVTPYLNTDPLNGVSSFDLVLITKHILQLQALDSPYKLIAADINKSGSITTMDLVQLRKLILHIDDEFISNTSWRFIESNYVFPQVNNPFATIFPEETFINGLVLGQEQNYVGVKIGDVNGSAVANSFTAVESRNAAEDLTFVAKDASLAVDETYEMVVRAADFNNVIGYQFTMNFDAAEMEFVGMAPGALPYLNEGNFGFTKANEGSIMTSWTSKEALSMDADAALFTLTFKAKKALKISEALSISSRYTKAEAYNGAEQLMEVGLRFEGETATAVANNVFALYQNQPNPFKSSTTIGFELPEAAAATLSIHDVSGRLLKQIEGDFVKGYNEVSLDKSDLQASGVVYYRLVTADFEATKKMMIVK
ncbi:MAG: hypothetical protein ACI8YQ_003153 [Polaribacter sp.]|jgi:hypothetical protein